MGTFERSLRYSTFGDSMIFGYIDPGSGSLLIQALIAGVLAVPFFFRERLASIFRRRR